MPRAARVTPGGTVFHVLNRANGGAQIFFDQGDYNAMLGAMVDTMDHVRMRVLSYCIMPNHWHLVLWPIADGDLGDFMQRLTITHVRRWHLYRQSVGLGHVYQGPYKSFPVECDEHFLTVCHYVERNPLRAHLVERAEGWRWSSLAARLHSRRLDGELRLTDWPVARPRDWISHVNQPQSENELAALRMSLARGRPFGSSTWQSEVARSLGLEFTMRNRGRPPSTRKRG